MTQAELNKLIYQEYTKAEQRNDTATMKKLDALSDKYIKSPFDNLTLAVQSDADLFRDVGLDKNTEISKMLATKPEEVIKQYSLLKDPVVLENLDKWSKDKWQAMASANGFRNVKEFQDMLYKAKGSYDQNKAWESERDQLYLPFYGRVNADNAVTRGLGKAQDWAARTFYPNAYEHAKRGDYSTGWNMLTDKSFLADQGLNAAAAASTVVGGGPLAQAALGGTVALGNEIAGQQLSDREIDLSQVPIGAGFGAFGGRVAGKSSGDLIKSVAGSMGLKKNGANLDKAIFGVADVLEDAAINPTREAMAISKNADAWLRKNVDANAFNFLTSANATALEKKAALEQLMTEAKDKDAPKEVLDWLESTKSSIVDIPIDNKWKTFDVDYDKNFWKRSVKNDLPTAANVDANTRISMLNKYGTNLDNYMIIDGKVMPRSMPRSSINVPYRSPNKWEFEEWIKTIPDNEIFRKSWAEGGAGAFTDLNRPIDYVRAGLQSGSQLYGSSRELKDSDLAAQVEGIKSRKPEDYEKYMNGEHSDLTYEEMSKIDELMQRGGK